MHSLCAMKWSTLFVSHWKIKECNVKKKKTEYVMEQYNRLLSSLDLYPPLTFILQPLGPS